VSIRVLIECARVGKDCNGGEHRFIVSRVLVDDNVTIKNRNMLSEGVILEDGGFVGPHAFFTNDLYPCSGRLPQARWRYKAQRCLLPMLVRQGPS